MPSQSLPSLKRFGFNARVNEPEPKVGVFADVWYVDQRSEDVLKKLFFEHQKIYSDPDLSAQGKARRLTKLGNDLLSEISDVSDKVPTINSRMNEMQRELAIPRKQQLSAEDMWIIDRLAQLPHNDRIKMLHEAIKLDDERVISAAFSAPPALRVVEPETADRIESLWSENHSPELWKNLNQLKSDHTTATTNLDTTSYYVKKECGLLDESTRARITKEQTNEVHA